MSAEKVALIPRSADKKTKPTRSGRLLRDWILPPSRSDHKRASAMLPSAGRGDETRKKARSQRAVHFGSRLGLGDAERLRDDFAEQAVSARRVGMRAVHAHDLIVEHVAVLEGHELDEHTCLD